MDDGGTHPSRDRAPDPLGALRRAVDDLHREVDRRSALGTTGLDVHRYARTLVVLARVLPTVERELVRRRRDRFGVEALTHLLLDDAASLGLDVDLDVGLDVGGARPPVSYDDPGAWWGAAYVLQGSRLGATVIADRLAAELPGMPRSYFDAASRGAAPAWARFRTVARQAFGSPDVDLVRSVTAARSVFEALLTEFDRTRLDGARFDGARFDGARFDRTRLDRTCVDRTGRSALGEGRIA